VARRGAAHPLRWAVAHLEGDDFSAWQARGGATRRRAPVEVNCYSSRRLPAQRVAATRRHHCNEARRLVAWCMPALTTVGPAMSD